MEGITPDKISLNSIASSSRNSSSGTTSDPSACGNPESGLNKNLSDISSLVKISENSQPDIRPDRIAHAQELLNDPNWINDQSLDLLAGKIIQEESF